MEKQNPSDKQQDNEEKLQVRVNLEGKWKTKFAYVKKHYGMSVNAEVIRVMITEVYRKIKREEREDRKFLED
ncbi:MAG: hypothetical protein ACXAC8_04550 [Candidatus Hodarchaeales archaeon]|jgi:hypothetical protein